MRLVNGSNPFGPTWEYEGVGALSELTEVSTRSGSISVVLP